MPPIVPYVSAREFLSEDSPNYLDLEDPISLATQGFSLFA
jgi:hypothetical protein